MSVDVTVGEAAELLNVSEAFMLGQVDAGALPFHIVDGRRRLRRAEMLAHRERMDATAEAALAAMAAEPRSSVYASSGGLRPRRVCAAREAR